MVDVAIYTRELEASLGKMGAELGRAPEMATAKQQIAMVALNDIRRDFVARSAPGNPFWPPLSVVTVVLRKRGRGGMIFSEEDLAARRAHQQKLRDEGLLLASLTAGGPGNIQQIGEFDVRVGTNRAGAGTHQDGGSSTFVFDEAKQARFKRNVSETIKGRAKPKKLPEGHIYRWNQGVIYRTKRHRKAIGLAKGPHGADKQGMWFGKLTWFHLRTEPSPWNQLYFRLYNYMKKISGTSRRVPKREIVSPPDERRLGKYARLYEAGVAALAERLGLSGQQTGGNAPATA